MRKRLTRSGEWRAIAQAPCLIEKGDSNPAWWGRTVMLVESLCHRKKLMSSRQRCEALGGSQESNFQ